MNKECNQNAREELEGLEKKKNKLFTQKRIIISSFFLVILCLLISIFHSPSGISLLNPEDFKDNPELQKYVLELKEAQNETGENKTILNSGIVWSSFPRINDKRVVDVLILCLQEKDPFFRQFINQCKKADLGSCSFDLNYLKRLVSIFYINRYKDTKGALRVEADFALGTIGDKRAVEPLIDHIQTYPDFISATYAASALKDIGDRRAILPMIEVLEDSPDNPYLINHLVKLMAFFRDPRSVPALTEILKNENRSIFVEPPIEALMKINNDEAVEAVVWALKNLKDPEYRQKAAFSLWKYGDERRIVPIIECFKTDKSFIVRAQAALCLGECKTEDVHSALVDSLKKETEESVLMETFIALGKHRKPGTYEILIPYLNDPYLKIHAIQGLGELRDKRAVDVLIPMFKSSKDPKLRGTIAMAFKEIRDERAVEVLKDGLPKAENDLERSRICMALGQIGDPGAIPAIDNLLRSDSNVDRFIALEAFGGIRTPGTLLVLVQYMKHNPEENLRTQAALSLGRSKDEKAIPYLLDAINEDLSRDVCIAALDSLKKINKKEPVTRLVEIWDDNKDLYLSIHIMDTLFKLSKDQKYLFWIMASLKNDDMIEKRDVLKALKEIKLNKKYSEYAIKHLEDEKWHEQAYELLCIIFVNTDDYEERIRIYQELRKYEEKHGL